MGVNKKDIDLGYLIPQCDECGIVEYWTISIKEYETWRRFWDGWKCDECHPYPKDRYSRFKRNMINSARICPYCYSKPEYVDSVEVYGRSYGMIYLCRDCDAYVGVHHGNSRKALGRLARKDLRDAKIEAHRYLDALWQRAQREKYTKKRDARVATYRWLADQMGKPMKETHIGMFDIEECAQVIEICKPYVRL